MSNISIAGEQNAIRGEGGWRLWEPDVPGQVHLSQGPGHHLHLSGGAHQGEEHVDRDDEQPAADTEGVPPGPAGAHRLPQQADEGTVSSHDGDDGDGDLVSALSYIDCLAASPEAAPLTKWWQDDDVYLTIYFGITTGYAIVNILSIPFLFILLTLYMAAINYYSRWRKINFQRIEKDIAKFPKFSSYFMINFHWFIQKTEKNKI